MVSVRSAIQVSRQENRRQWVQGRRFLATLGRQPYDLGYKLGVLGNKQIQPSQPLFLSMRFPFHGRQAREFSSQSKSSSSANMEIKWWHPVLGGFVITTAGGLKWFHDHLGGTEGLQRSISFYSKAIPKVCCVFLCVQFVWVDSWRGSSWVLGISQCFKLAKQQMNSTFCIGIICG